MRVTLQDIVELTGADDPRQLLELGLCNRYVDEVGYVAKLGALQSLNLGFNELRSTRKLGALGQLLELNVMHNRLLVLDGLGGCARLRVLRASSNRVADIAGVAGCSELRDVWLQCNRLGDADEFLGVLARLPHLHTLVALPNPCCPAGCEAAFRHLAVASLRSLVSLDGVAVSDGDREDADAFVAASGPELVALRRAGRGDTPGQRPRGGGWRAGAAAAAAATSGSEPAGAAAAAHARDDGEGANSDADADTGRAVEDEDGLVALAAIRSKLGLLSSGLATEYLQPAPVQSAPRRAGPAKREQARSRRVAAQEVRETTEREAHASLRQQLRALAGEPPEPTESTPQPGRRRSSSGRASASRGAGRGAARSAGAAAGTGAPRRRRPPPVAVPSRCAGAQASAAVGAADFVKCYRGGKPAVIVRSDGSAEARWPSGALAVSVSRERLGFRMHAAARRTGQIAVSFDEHGNGHANYESSGTCISHNEVSGGFYADERGFVQQSWVGTGGMPAVPVSADADGAGGSDADPGRPISVQLDAHLSVHFSVREGRREASVLFAAKGVRHEFGRGPNPCCDVWTEGRFAGDGLDRQERRQATTAGQAMSLTQKQEAIGGVGEGLDELMESLRRKLEAD